MDLTDVTGVDEESQSGMTRHGMLGRHLNHGEVRSRAERAGGRCSDAENNERSLLHRTAHDKYGKLV